MTNTKSESPTGVPVHQADYVLHVDGSRQIDPATQAAINKMAALLRAKELIRTGNAAVDKTGRVVDRREHPDAVSIPAHDNKAQMLPRKDNRL